MDWWRAGDGLMAGWQWAGGGLHLLHTFNQQKRIFVKPYLNPQNPVEFNLLLHQVSLLDSATSRPHLTHVLAAGH